MTHDLHKIQPYIDGELAPSERAEVEAQLARDPALRDMVEAQRQIRQVLRDMPRATAPQALRARVLLDLDAIDREQAAPAPTPPAPRLARLRAFLRGAAVMVPAGAAALALFVVARNLDRPASPSPGPRDIAVRIVDVPETSPIRPVSLRAGSEVVYQIGTQRIIDRQEPASGATPGAPRVYRGAAYAVAQDALGRVAVVFDAAGVRHTLSLDLPEGAVLGAPDREVAALLELGHLVRSDAARPE